VDIVGGALLLNVIRVMSTRFWQFWHFHSFSDVILSEKKKFSSFY